MGRYLSIEVMGMVMILIVVTIGFLSLTSPANSNLSLFFAFSLLCLSAVSLVFTRRNVLGLRYMDEGVKKGGQDSNLIFSFVVENPTSLARSRLSIDLDGASVCRFDLPPYSKQRVSLSLSGKGRGSYALNGLRLSSDFPIGFFSFSEDIGLTLSYLCLPITQSIYNDITHQCGTQHDDNFSIEGLEEYKHGDPVNRIYWPLYAKTDKLAIRHVEDDADSPSSARHVLDWSMEKGSDETRILSLTSQIVFFHQHQIEYSLVLPSFHVPFGRGGLHFNRCVALLANFNCPHETVSFGLTRSSTLRSAGGSV